MIRFSWRPSSARDPGRGGSWLGRVDGGARRKATLFYPFPKSHPPGEDLWAQEVGVIHGDLGEESMRLRSPPAHRLKPLLCLRKTTFSRGGGGAETLRKCKGCRRRGGWGHQVRQTGTVGRRHSCFRWRLAQGSRARFLVDGISVLNKWGFALRPRSVWFYQRLWAP